MIHDLALSCLFRLLEQRDIYLPTYLLTYTHKPQFNYNMTEVIYSKINAEHLLGESPLHWLLGYWCH